MYSMRTVRVTVTYADTLTERRGGKGRERVTVRLQYAYCQSYSDLCGYSDRGEGVGKE